MAENVLKTKSYNFALRTVKLSLHLASEKKEFVLSKQLLRSGTSIGANIEEANQAQSKLDFIHKLSISQKESFETHYWIRLLRDSDLIKPSLADSLLTDCQEIQKLLTSSIKTAKSRLGK
jgi:four helix bundle protein